MWSIMQKWLLITFINREIKQRRRHGNAYGKKAIRLDWQNNHSARASRFFVHFFERLGSFIASECFLVNSIKDWWKLSLPGRSSQYESTTLILQRRSDLVNLDCLLREILLSFSVRSLSAMRISQTVLLLADDSPLSNVICVIRRYPEHARNRPNFRRSVFGWRWI